MDWWLIAESALWEADVKAEINRMMTSKRFKELVALAQSERWTDDEKAASMAVLSAMMVYDDPKRQAAYAKAYLAKDKPAPGDDEPW